MKGVSPLLNPWSRIPFPVFGTTCLNLDQSMACEADQMDGRKLFKWGKDYMMIISQSKR